MFVPGILNAGNEYKILVRKSEGKRPLGRPRRRWEDNIKTGSFRNRVLGWTEFIL
jgi:hypothetical protein